MRGGYISEPEDKAAGWEQRVGQAEQETAEMGRGASRWQDLNHSQTTYPVDSNNPQQVPVQGNDLQLLTFLLDQIFKFSTCVVLLKSLFTFHPPNLPSLHLLNSAPQTHIHIAVPIPPPLPWYVLYTHIHITHTRTHTQTYTLTYIHMHTQHTPHAYKHTHTNTHTHTHIHIHTCTHTCTHIYT